MQYTLALNQRWCDGRASYRPPTEPIRTAEYEVAEMSDDTTARQFITHHHYSHTYPAARFRVGLYRHGELVGVAVFSHPCSNVVLTNVFEAPVLTTVELGRFVLLDSVAGNGETWFLARSFEILRKHAIVGVVSFSDPLQRRTASGEVIHMGHVGTIYQAHNGTYLGRGTARTLHLLPDGRVFSDRAAQKIRNSERGSRPSVPQMFPRTRRRAQNGSTHPCNHWRRESGTRETTSMPGLSTSRSGVNCRRAFLIRSRWIPFTPRCKEKDTSQPLIADFALERRASWQIGVERRAATTSR